MVPYFSTGGSCVPGRHFMLPPERRLVRAMELVERGQCFSLHAARKTGKTTSARWLVDHHKARGAYGALWVDLEPARGEPDLDRGLRAVLLELDRALSRDLPAVERPNQAFQEAQLRSPSSAVLECLQQISASVAKPLVIVFDEADGLAGETRVSFLTQLRQGYLARGFAPFPHSVVLVGRRQVRFDIPAEAPTLAPFAADEVAELLAQHTAATGQRFEADAAALVHGLSQGYPWLVNALADRMVRDVPDRGAALTAAHVEQAREMIILERRTPIDSLVARLRERRVRRIIAPMLAGGQTAGDVLDDDFNYVVGLGLIVHRAGRWEVANPIYREVIPRALTYVQQTQIPDEPAWYLRADGGLDMLGLLRGFQTFWRRDGHLVAEGFGYREAGPHLMLMAFLQWIVDSGGRVEREYGLGRGRLDLIVQWHGEQHVVEVKLRRDTETEQEALEQLARYLDGLGLDEGYLVLFDLRQGLSWEERILERGVELAGKRVVLLGC